MAGTLPGVEAARRRRLHLSSSGGVSGGSNSSSRRPSYCLYAPNHLETHLFSGASVERIAIRDQNDEKLGHLARKAKEKLDERLRAPRKTEFRRRNNSDASEERARHINGRATNTKELRTEVFGSKKKNKFSWTRLGWKPWEEEECAVCLDQFKGGENVVNLPCSHRFHSRCLVPWLETNSQCPCCRTTIYSTHPSSSQLEF